MNSILHYLLQLPDWILWLTFLCENIAITMSVLFIGKLFQQKYKTPTTIPYHYTAREIILCCITNVLNTVVTYTGYWLWKHGVIEISVTPSFIIVSDFIIMFMAMDLLMYIFHFIIHKTFLYKTIHQLHHQAVDPKPIDLFVLHPIETLCFGGLWLIVLVVHPFNIYAIMAYLTINVIFGLVGHLGLEPLSEKLRQSQVLKYLGTSTFHHDHHQDVKHNFGFYTSVWDRVFGTYGQY